MRATIDFQPHLSEATQYAEQLGLSQSDYIRQAIIEKNERMLDERIAALSARTSGRSHDLVVSLDATLNDGLEGR